MRKALESEVTWLNPQWKLSAKPAHFWMEINNLEATLHRYVAFYNPQLPQSALGSRTPLQAMKDWQILNPDLFKKQPYHLPGWNISLTDDDTIGSSRTIPSG